MVDGKALRLNEMTWQDVEEYLKHDNTILVPIGSTEEHGPAAPLGLDTYVAIAIAEDVSAATGVITAPPIWFGDSAHHLAFPGTVSIRTETLAEYVKDVLRSLVKHGFRKIVIINGHKITNLDALNTATRNLKEYEFPDVFFAIVDPIRFAGAAKERESEEHHSGELETSHLMYKFPHLIRAGKLPANKPEFEKKYSRFMKTDLFAGGDSIIIPWSSAEQRKLAENGALSDASRASKDKGKKYHDYIVQQTVEFVEWLKKK